MKRKLEELVDLSALQQLVNYFATATGLGIRLVGPRGYPFDLAPANQCALCTLAQQTSLGAEECRRTFKQAGIEALRWGNPYIFTCPMGLMEFAVPIVADGNLLGIILCGQVLIHEQDDILYAKVIDKTHEFGLKKYLVDKALEDVHTVSGAKVQAAAELLHLMTQQLVKLGEETLTQKREIAEQQMRLAEFIHHRKSIGDLPHIYPLEKERELIGAVRLGETTHAKEILNDLLGLVILQPDLTPEKLKARVLELVVMLSRAAVEAGAELEQVLGANLVYLRELADINSPDELYQWTVKALEGFTDGVRRSRNLDRVKMVQTAVNYIKEHLEDEVTLEKVSATVNKSPAYFSRILKEELGMNFNEYLNKTRIEAAQQMLHSKDKNLAEVAYAVGYNDQSYFTKIFKQHTGLTPTQYRKRAG